ncbi:hypothetical protein L4C36_22285 [Photobacterium japonica]|uniref:hypothetical protein n=1 Tax=Photobacterium japonica TaxID=2910235 RepID=UPI003D0F0341
MHVGQRVVVTIEWVTGKLLTANVVLMYVLMVFGLYFNFHLYAQLPVGAGDPYGIGDVIYLILYVVMIALWLSSFAFAVIYWLCKAKENGRRSCQQFLLSSVGFAIYISMLFIA